MKTATQGLAATATIAVTVAILAAPTRAWSAATLGGLFWAAALSATYFALATITWRR